MIGNKDILSYEYEVIQKAIEFLPGFTIGEVDIPDDGVERTAEEEELVLKEEIERALASAQEEKKRFEDIFYPLAEKFFGYHNPFMFESNEGSFVVNNVFNEKFGYAYIGFYSLDDVLESVVESILDERDCDCDSVQEAKIKYCEEAAQKIKLFAKKLTRELCFEYEDGFPIDGEFLMVIFPYRDNENRYFSGKDNFALQMHELPTGFVGELSDKHASTPRKNKKMTSYLRTFGKETAVQRFVNVLKSNIAKHGDVEILNNNHNDEKGVYSEYVIKGYDGVTDRVVVIVQEGKVITYVIDKANRKEEVKDFEKPILKSMGNILNRFVKKAKKIGTSKNFSNTSQQNQEEIVKKEMENAVKAEMEVRESAEHQELTTWDRGDEIKLARGLETWVSVLCGALLMCFLHNPVVLIIFGGALLLSHTGLLSPILYNMMQSVKSGWKKFKAGMERFIDGLFGNKFGENLFGK